MVASECTAKELLKLFSRSEFHGFVAVFFQNAKHFDTWEFLCLKFAAHSGNMTHFSSVNPYGYLLIFCKCSLLLNYLAYFSYHWLAKKLGLHSAVYTWVLYVQPVWKTRIFQLHLKLSAP